MIKFSHASPGHEFMVDVVLDPEQGVITHSVFADEEEEDEKKSNADSEEEGV